MIVLFDRLHQVIGDDATGFGRAAASTGSAKLCLEQVGVAARGARPRERRSTFFTELAAGWDICAAEWAIHEPIPR